MRNHVVLNTLVLALAATSTSNAGSLHISYWSYGPGDPLNHWEVNNSAMAGDVLANVSNTTTVGVGTSGSGKLVQSAGARATFGDVGAYSTLLFRGDHLGTDYPRVMSRAIFQDTLTFADLSGIPEYLQVDISIDGSGDATNFSYWRVSSWLTLNSASIQFIADCGDALQTSEPCGGDLSVSPYGGPPATEVVPGFGLSRTLLIPWSWVVSNNQIILYSDFNVDAQIGMAPSTVYATASADYFSSSKVGGLRVLDANLVDLGVQFTSESGHDYTQPLASSVPEPSTWIGLLSGAAGLLLLHRRRIRTCTSVRTECGAVRQPR